MDKTDFYSNFSRKSERETLMGEVMGSLNDELEEVINKPDYAELCDGEVHLVLNVLARTYRNYSIYGRPSHCDCKSDSEIEIGENKEGKYKPYISGRSKQSKGRSTSRICKSGDLPGQKIPPYQPVYHPPYKETFQQSLKRDREEREYEKKSRDWSSC